MLPKTTRNVNPIKIGHLRYEPYSYIIILMIHQDMLSEKKQQKLYLLHHMHHYPDGEEIVHELHHCYLFSEPKKKGERYSLDHITNKGKLYHILDKKPPEVLYDHAGNPFEVQKIEMEGREYYCIV